MKQAYLYCDPRSLNDATRYYLSIIMSVIETNGYNCKTVYRLADIKIPDLIITVTEKYFLKAYLRFRTKTIYWSQGVGAEERKLTIKNCFDFKSIIGYTGRLVSEFLAINRATIVFCVSQRQADYYSEKYGYRQNKDRLIIMPCYNLRLSHEFTLDQYKKPIFTYAGNASTWQGVDFVLDVFKEIENKLPEAKLKLYTGDKDSFIAKLTQRNISNYEIDYVSLDVLQHELHKCKYGFIIRDNSIVNQVATPTKMNSYLASYIIPIFSETVGDFKENIKLGEFTIMCKHPLDAKIVANEILNFEAIPHDFNGFRGYVERVFDNHYNDERYIEKINYALSVNGFISEVK